jgi:hypothetical protein
VDNDAERSDLLEHGYGQVIADPAAAESKSRAAYRWRRRVTIVASAIALGAVAVGGVLLTQTHAPAPVGLPAGDSATEATGTAPASAADTPPASASTASAPADTAPATTTAQPVPTASPQESVAPASMPADLHIAGPTEVTLTPSNGKYAGTLTLTVSNTGPTPYGQTGVDITMPAGVTVDFSNGPPFGPCVFQGSASNWVCGGQVVPARGGTLTYHIQLVADYAPQATGLTISGFDLRVQALSDAGTAYPDPTPGDNEIAVQIKLAPAA